MRFGRPAEGVNENELEFNYMKAKKNYDIFGFHSKDDNRWLHHARVKGGFH